MGRSSDIPVQTLALIQHYFIGNRKKDLVFIDLEFCLADGTEDDWIDTLDKAIEPIIQYVYQNKIK